MIHFGIQNILSAMFPKVIILFNPVIKRIHVQESAKYMRYSASLNIRYVAPSLPGNISLDISVLRNSAD
jgi:hypothetical protein